MRNLIFVNKSPHGKISVVVMGICSVIDGLVRILSLGFLTTRLPLEYARISAKNHFKKLREKQNV